MAWADLRARLAAEFDGATWQADEHQPEALQCEEFPSKSRETRLPFAYVVPPRMRFSRGPGKWQVETLDEDPRVRVLLSSDKTPDLNALTKRHAAATAACGVVLMPDSKRQLGGTVDVMQDTVCGGLAWFEEDLAWGFDISIEGVRMSSTVS